MELEQYYDEVPYASHPFQSTRPENLQALGTLFGLTPADPRTCRVLELGCASGGNIIPLAARFPEAEVVGVDLSRVQIEKGQATVEANGGLENLSLRHGSISDIDGSWGKFDYIICHGVFSWVPPDVQEAIFRVVNENLADDGIAYISYNTYPGWKAREVIRDAMLLRSAKETDPTRRLALARGIVDFLSDHVPDGALLKAAMKDGSAIVNKYDPTYLAHEFLEPFNAPMYFQQFVEKANGHGLAYLGDAIHQIMFLQNYPEGIQKPLQDEVQGDHELMEQYLDYVVGRTFRQSLLIHANAAHKVVRAIAPENLENFAFWSDLKDVAPAEGQSEVTEFQDDANNRFNATNAVVRAIVETMRERFPAPASYQELFDAVKARTDMTPDVIRRELGEALRILTVKASIGMVLPSELIARNVGERPRTLDYLRNAAANFVKEAGGATSTSMTSLTHRDVSMDFYAAWILSNLNGQNDLDALVDLAKKAVENGTLHVTNANGEALAGDEIEAHFRQTIPVALDKLRRSGFLVNA